MGNLIFETELQAELAQSLIATEMGLPKYGIRLDGTLNPKVIIDRYAIPCIQEDGKWTIPADQEWQDLLTSKGIAFEVIEINANET